MRNIICPINIESEIESGKIFSGNQFHFNLRANGTVGTKMIADPEKKRSRNSFLMVVGFQELVSANLLFFIRSWC